MYAADKTLAKRYARAYMSLDGKAFGAALEAASGAKLADLRNVFEAARPFLKILAHPAINGEMKLEVLDRILGSAGASAQGGGKPPHGKGRAPRGGGGAAEFAGLLVKQGRFNLFEEILGECLRLYDSFCGVLRAEVCSRSGLPEAGLKSIEGLLAGIARGKISLRQVMNERVVGGFEIKVGDLVIDATVRGRLDALRKDLLVK